MAGPLGFPKLRIVSANLSSDGQYYARGGPGARILKGLKPDVILLQEANTAPGRRSSDQDFQDWTHETFGPEYQAYREPGEGIPNAIISRYPIRKSGEWAANQTDDRDFAYARIDIPGERDLLAVSVHLRTKQEIRSSEAREVVDYVRAEATANDYVVVGGDFNTDKRGESTLRTLNQVVDVAAPFPVDADGNESTNHNRNKPYDGVYVTRDLEAHEVPVQLGTHSYAAGVVIDTRELPDLEALAPALRGDSDAVEMQHMAVARDFELVP